MAKSYAIRTRVTDSKKAELIAISTFANAEQLNSVVAELYQTRDDMNKKVIEFLDVGPGFLLHFHNSRFKQTDLYLANPKLDSDVKKMLLNSEWQSMDDLRKSLSACAINPKESLETN